MLVSKIDNTKNSYVSNNLNKKNFNSNNVDVAFRGNIGDKFLKEINNSAYVTPERILEEVKGTFGIRGSKVKDVLESFINRVRKLYNDRADLRRQLYEANRKISNFPNEKDKAVFNAQEEMRKSYESFVDAKNKEVAAKDKELQEAKEIAERFRPAYSVKSIEEMGIIMPDKAIEVIKEMSAKRKAACSSMLEYLFTGKGQEEALAQIERNNILFKARKDGIFNIKAVDDVYFENLRHGARCMYDFDYTIELISHALQESSKGNYILSPAIKAQVKKNAMALLTPMANPKANKYENNSLTKIEEDLYKQLKNAEKFHEGINKAIVKYKNRYPKAEVKLEIVDFEGDKSNLSVIFKSEEDGESFKTNILFASDYGNRGY